MMKTAFILSALLWHASAVRAGPLPDGEITRLGAWTAMLTGPTTRYTHGALGDDVEAEGFSVETAGKVLQFTLDEMHVFEDLRVRLVELDDDSFPEAVIIRSHLEKGAAIAVYDISADAMTLKAESQDVGRANRWLNIAGFGDFTGRGKVEIAAVITPHLAGSLRIYEIRGGSVAEIARIDGYTNHVNGTRQLDLAKLADINGDGATDIMLPRIDGSGTAAVTFAGGLARELPE